MIRMDCMADHLMDSVDNFMDFVEDSLDRMGYCPLIGMASGAVRAISSLALGIITALAFILVFPFSYVLFDDKSIVDVCAPFMEASLYGMKRGVVEAGSAIPLMSIGLILANMSGRGKSFPEWTPSYALYDSQKAV